MFTTTLRALTLVCGLMLLAYPVRATHVMGSDITMQNLGGDSFLITVNVYRDCKGIPMSTSPIIAAAVCGGWTKSLSTTLSGGADMTPVCKTSCTRCTNSNCSVGFGIERYQLTAMVDFSTSTCCDFVVSWEQCCRNSGISTGASNQNYYISSTVNKCKIKGSTPVFEFDPIILTCKDNCVQRFQSAKGEDGDRLIYSLTEPLSGAYAAIPYSHPYTYDAPFMYSGYPNATFSPSTCKGFYFDQATAEMRFKPTQEEITVYAIKVEQLQWDGSQWIKVSEVRQDVQTAVVACPSNRPPMISGINGGTTTALTVGVGKSLCFKVSTWDPDSNDSLLLGWNYAIPDATFTVSTGKLPSGTFCWTPSRGYIGTTSFVVKAEEANVCPIPTIIQQGFTITVLDTLPAFSLSVKDTQCATRCYSVQTGSSTSGLAFAWSVNGVAQTNATKNFCYTFPSSGKYKVQATITKSGFNPQVLEDSLDVILPAADAGKDTIICRGDSFQLAASGGKTYQWKSAPGLTNTSIANPWVKPVKSQLYHLTATDSGGCTSEDSVLIQVDSTCVWPGDANSDKKVTTADVLNIGLAYFATGTSRIGASNNWVPQASADWGTATKGVDYKHADCNGDGVVNLSDLGAIGLNFGKSHPKGGIQDNDVNGVPLFFQFSRDTFYASDTVSASLILGTSAKPADGAYGVTVAYGYTGKWMNEGSYTFQTGCNLFCDKDGFQLNFDKQDVTAFSGEQAIVRTDRIAATGSGELAHVSFVLKDSTHDYDAQGEWIYAYFTDAKLIDKNGDKLGVNAISDSALVFRTTIDVPSGIKRGIAFENKVRVYPNPANQLLVIEAGGFNVQSMHLYNQLGQEVLVKTSVVNAGRNELDVSHLPQGMYTLVLKNNSDAVSKRILIQR
jgi:hypothetical protein